MIKINSEELATFLLKIYNGLADGDGNGMEDLDEIFRRNPDHFYAVDGYEWHLRKELEEDGYFDENPGTD